MSKRLKKINSIFMVILLFMTLSTSSINAQAKSFFGESSKQPVIVIDPGCQSITNDVKEAIGPGEWKRISEDMVGVKGVATENNEYDINLQVSKKVKELLSQSDYKVELTRTKNDVDMTNSDRAMVANSLSADLYISIHASNPDEEKDGITIICQTADNPYSFTNYRDSRLLADALLGSLVEKTSVGNYEVKESDELMGINWCTVPNAVVEIGNLNNPEDDEKLADEAYQDKLAEGIVAGIDSYFSQK